MIGHGIGIPFGQNRNAPFPGDLAFDFNTRTDLVLNNRIGDNGSLIGGYVGDFNGSSYFETSNNFEIGKTLYLTINFDNVAASEYFIGFGSSSQGLRYNGSTFLLFASSGYSTVSWVNTGGFVNIEITRKSSRYYDLTIDNNYIGELYHGDTDVLDNGMKIGTRGDGSIGFAHYISYFNCNNEAFYYLNNHLINSVNGAAATNNGVTFTLINNAQLQSVKDALNEGYYIDGSGNKIINPQYAATTEEVVLGGRFYNGIECFALLPNTPLFDRSNATTHNSNSTDSVYYDASYPTLFYMGKFDFDISPTETITAYGELDYNVIQTYLTSSYMQLIFTKISQNYGDGNEDYIDRILAYSTQKTDDDLLRVLRYINYFDNTLNYVQDENGNYVLDIFNRPLTE